MSSRVLSFSLGLNLVLLAVAGYRTARIHSAGSMSSMTGTVAVSPTNPSIENGPELVSSSTAIAAAPLRWSDLESGDYPIYVANLRKAGCPEPILRRIIGADLKELYARKAFALTQEFQRDFWVIAARENVRDYFDRSLAQQVKALCSEPDTLLNQLLGEPSSELRPVPSTATPENRLTPEQLGEYNLRQSPAAKEIQGLYGVDFSEVELRNLAKILDEYHRRAEIQAETDSETLDQTIQAVLGPERFADFNRARSASYRELCELVSDFDRPAEAAAEIFDLRLNSEKQSDEIRADKNRSIEQKQEVLDDLQEQVEKTMLIKLGAEAYQSYKAGEGRWINSLGRL